MPYGNLYLNFRLKMRMGTERSREANAEDSLQMFSIASKLPTNLKPSLKT
jgi:hypothetical protein